MFDVIVDMFTMNPGVVIALCAFFVIVFIAIIAAVIASVATAASVETRDGVGDKE
ncbi:MAG: hypothetical protein K6A45_05985 [Lachnospiraceae bacterium]|jgi:FtsH-binding integral membrane protein|nr:hypothetical protein [Lachnospiraceae bacterium]